MDFKASEDEHFQTNARNMSDAGRKDKAIRGGVGKRPMCPVRTSRLAYNKAKKQPIFIPV